MKVKTRFAPSPTGFMHVGGVRTALFAWLVAKQAGGQFVLRIEDTDRERHVEDSEQHIIDSLEWLGLKPDEGPFRQSERLDIYKEWADKLVASGRAYADTTTPHQLDELRQQAKAAKKPFLFRDHRPANPPEWKEDLPLRFKSDPKDYKWNDAVMGELSTGPEVIDDFIILKSDGFPTYNFAHIIDDHLMEISHVIRSQEFLPSIPKFLNLYEALEIEPPILATLPFVLGPDGHKKLSKRDGAKDILDYKREGYLPEATTSFLATLGWNDGTEQEVFTTEELIKKFSLERVQRSGASFDDRRLLWVDGHFIRETPLDELYQLVEEFWGNEAKGLDTEFKKRILRVHQERIKFLSEIPELASYFVKPLESADARAEEIKDLFQNNKGTDDDPTPVEWLNKIVDSIGGVDINEPGSYEEPLSILIEKESGQKLTLYGSLRIALTGAPRTPSVAETIYALGEEESAKRLRDVIAELEK